MFETHGIAKEALYHVNFATYHTDYYRKRRDALAPSGRILPFDGIAELKAHPILRDLRNLRGVQEQSPTPEHTDDSGVELSTSIDNDQISQTHIPKTNNLEHLALASSSQTKVTNAMSAPRIALDELTGNVGSFPLPSEPDKILYSALENENENENDDKSPLIPWDADPQLFNQLLTLLEVNKRWRVGIYGPVVSENGFTVSKTNYYCEIASTLFSKHPLYRESHSLNETMFASLIQNKLEERHV